MKMHDSSSYHKLSALRKVRPIKNFDSQIYSLIDINEIVLLQQKRTASYTSRALIIYFLKYDSVFYLILRNVTVRITYTVYI